MWIKFYIKALLNGFSFKRAIKQANLDNRTIPDSRTKEEKEALLKSLNKYNEDVTSYENATKDISERFDSLYALFPENKEDK